MTRVGVAEIYNRTETLYGHNGDMFMHDCIIFPIMLLITILVLNIYFLIIATSCLVLPQFLDELIYMPLL